MAQTGLAGVCNVWDDVWSRLFVQGDCASHSLPCTHGYERESPLTAGRQRKITDYVLHIKSIQICYSCHPIVDEEHDDDHDDDDE